MTISNVNGNANTTANTNVSDVLVIGSGPAGYTAAIYAARAGRSTKLISGPQPGGQLMITSFIENYPGFIEPISGPVLMDQMRQQAERMGVDIISDTIESVDFARKPFACFSESKICYESKTVIIATGANAKWLDVPGEQRYRGVGVSACATCDGFFFRNKNVAVIGGGNAAAEEASYLTNFAQKVVLIHRRDQLRAEKIMQKRLFENPKIEIMWNTKVLSILGDENKVTELSLLKLKNDSNDSEELQIPIDGVFVAIGHQPATSIFKNHLKTTSEGYIVTEKGSASTSVAGVFAAGDVCDPTYRQAIVSAGHGCMAALDADRYLSALSASA